MENCEQILGQTKYDQNSGRRPHLTKDQRLPRCYKDAEKILKSVKLCHGSVKSLLNNTKLRGSVLSKVYALCTNVLKYSPFLDKVMDETELLKKETFLRKELAAIMIHELLFGKGLPAAECKPVIIIKKYQEDIERVYRNSLLNGTITLADVQAIPRYVRINTLLTSIENVLQNLEYWGYQRIRLNRNTTFDEYLDLVKTLEPGSFLIDYHFKDLLVFAKEESLSQWSLYQKSHVFIQDKSSYIPVHVLNPEPGSTVVDACAAPGLKTTHIAASMENSGKIYAFEIQERRFKVLQNVLESANVKICSAECSDFYSVYRSDPKFESVEYILVDPTCSGSGMVNRMDSITDTEESKNDMRIQKLAGFQMLLLKHALSFPNVKRVVYSTCSVTEQENEFVVHEVLNHFQHRFKLAPVMPHWPIRGLENYEFGTLCLRAYPEKSLTNGFFVAMFERLNPEEEQHYRNSHFSSENILSNSPDLKVSKIKKRKKNSRVQEDEHESETSNLLLKNEFTSSYKSENDKCKDGLSNDEFPDQNEMEQFKNADFVPESSFSKINKKKKKKNIPKSESPENEFQYPNLNFVPENSLSKSHKKKRKKAPNSEQEEHCENISSMIGSSFSKYHKKENKTKNSKSEEKKLKQENPNSFPENHPLTSHKTEKIISELLVKGASHVGNSNVASEKLLFDCNKAKAVKLKKRKRESKLQKDDRQQCLNSNITSERSVSEPLRSESTKKLKLELPCANDVTHTEDCTLTIKNSNSITNENKIDDLPRNYSCEQKSEIAKVKKKKKHSYKDRKLLEDSASRSEPIFPAFLPRVLEVKNFGEKKQKKIKHCKAALEEVESNTADLTNQRRKKKKSKRLILFDDDKVTVYQPSNENEISENESKLNKTNEDVNFNICESSINDFENNYETAPDSPKSKNTKRKFKERREELRAFKNLKHKKKCKDKKYKDDYDCSFSTEEFNE